MNISSKKYFADWITTIIKPCCIVYSSQKAKDIISKNNLTPSEYLRPFGDFKEFTITSPFNKKLIKSFILDFIDSEEFNSIPKDKYNITTKIVTDDYKGKNMICSRCKTLVAIIEKPKATRGYIVLPIVSAQC